MGIGMVAMAMIMVMTMTMTVVMRRLGFWTGADAFDMMVVAFLR